MGTAAVTKKNNKTTRDFQKKNTENIKNNGKKKMYKYNHKELTMSVAMKIKKV